MNENECFNLFKNFRFFSREEQISCLQSLGLLLLDPTCNTCNSRLILTRREVKEDKYCWRCKTINCPKYKIDVSIRKNSFFENEKISFVQLMEVIYNWARDRLVKDAAKEAEIAQKTAIKIYARLKTLDSTNLRSFPIQLGGPGIVCEVDESLMCHKVKAHRGRAPAEQVWVFGIADRSTKPPSLYMEVVPDRSSATLIPIINRICRVGSIIHSDMFMVV